MSKLLTVVGATGKQGGAVIKAIQEHPKLSKEYRLRGVTRDPAKPSGKALQNKGVEAVKGDLSDQKSLEKAFEGSDAVFAVTNYWEVGTKENELKQGKAIADAAKAANVKFVVWSALPHVTRMTNGKLKHVVHFDSKAEVGDYMLEIGLPVAFFEPGFYMDNIKDFTQKGDDGSVTWVVNFHPTTAIPLLDAADDTGKFVAALLQNQDSMKGKSILGASGFWTPTECMEIVTRVTGQKASFKEVSDEEEKGFLPPHMADEITENFILVREYGYFGPTIEESKKRVAESLTLLDLPLTSFDDFVRKTGPW